MQRWLQILRLLVSGQAGMRWFQSARPPRLVHLTLSVLLSLRIFNILFPLSLSL